MNREGLPCHVCKGQKNHAMMCPIPDVIPDMSKVEWQIPLNTLLQSQDWEIPPLSRETKWVILLCGVLAWCLISGIYLMVFAP